MIPPYRLKLSVPSIHPVFVKDSARLQATDATCMLLPMCPYGFLQGLRHLSRDSTG